ncbi:MFS transporter [Sphingomonas lacunae]|uniref:MFS transporter n=1 Tax=Sphingomonas lacunae TaxID=2698828 RepID=A0A6M4AT20_9SPHN|nr:MFS transporter [Sphingomonas lacunae]QJQ32185.1 MFS transporter [Sphingomonas lacunae]
MALAQGGQRSPYLLLGFFLLLHVLNQVDRNLIAGFGPEIVRDLGLSRTQFGIVAGIAFTAFYAVTALAAGVLADRFGRVRILALGLATWSAFTALSGLARGFLSLVAMRPLVATGEATLIPAATAILSERFSPQRRASAIGIFFMGVPLGVGASFFLAGQLGPILGWRGVFVLLGLLGLILVLALKLLVDENATSRSLSDATQDEAQPSPSRSATAVLADLGRELRTNADLRLAILGSVLMHVYLAGGPFVKIWLLEERGFDGNGIAMTYGLALLVFGVIGAVAGGTLADLYAKRFPGGRAMFLALFVTALAPLIMAFRLADAGSILFYVGMGAGILFFSSFYGPAFAVMQSVSPARLHASVTGLAMLLVNVLALGIGGVLIGVVSDVLVAQGRHDALSLPLIIADIISLLTIFCFARIGWREWRNSAQSVAGA